VNQGGVRVQRLYDATLAELWDALTEPDSVKRWLGRPMPGRVTSSEPHRLLELEWNVPGEGATYVRFELQEEAGGVRLIVDHRGLDRVASTAYGEGWKHHLLDLESVVNEGAVT
jgi:uncharacterized protein YndB with AHSA1/START domain